MSEPSVPARLGQYEIVRRLAYGGMAEVFLARLRGVDGFAKDVVIKRVLPQHSSNVEFIMMFRDEARITARLQHGNIVQVIEFSEADGQHYLVLEYVNGPSLASALSALQAKGSRLTVAEASHIASEVARALDYAHRKRAPDGTPLQIVHRDVTPSNILISREGEVKLADFGIARARARLAVTAGGGILKGKLAYMAPETLRAGQGDSRTDLFSLGAVIYQMLTGRHAFRGETEAETMGNILFHEPPVPSSVNPSVPKVLDDLVKSLLDPEPDRRPARALVVADTLARELPAGEPPAEALARTLAGLFSDAASRPSDPAPTLTPRSTRPRVLVVDESRTVRAVLRAGLSPDYAVVETASIDDALVTLRSGPRFCGVLCQRTVAGVPGLDLCRRIREDDKLAEVVFVLLASDEPEGLLAQARVAGAHAVVKRSPPDIARLSELLRPERASR